MNAECKVVIAVLFILYRVKMAKHIVKFLHDLMPQCTSLCRTKFIPRLLENCGKNLYSTRHTNKHDWMNT